MIQVLLTEQLPALEAGALYALFTDAAGAPLAPCPAALAALPGMLGARRPAADGQTGSFTLPAGDGLASVLLGVVADAADAESWRNAAGVLVREAGRLGLSAATAFMPESDAARAAFVRGMTEGAALAAYRFDTYKTFARPAFASLTLAGAGAAAAQPAVDEALLVCEEVNFARSLVDEIGSVLTPEVLARKTRERAEAAGVECEIWDEERIRTEGMGALYAVGRGAAQPPRFIILRYNGAPESETRLALIGKGVTFDTGGYCLKPGSGMMDMKDDMGGAAAVLATVIAAARAKLPVNLVAVVGACENSIDRGGFKPGDILRTLKGTTVEVINTDAEGRLTLADAVYYAATREKATHLVDAATLTGSAISTFGSYYNAVVSDDEALYSKLTEAAAVTGEHFWRLPCDKRYRKLLDSKVADMKNLAGREGGCIIAGMFIKDFTEGLPWVHMDLCGAYYGSPREEFVTDLATGQPVRTLFELARRLPG